MNRKEFKKLLVEWNQNFINERGLNLPVGMSIKKPELQKGHLISLSLEEAGNLFNHILDYIVDKKINYFKDCKLKCSIITSSWFLYIIVEHSSLFKYNSSILI